MKKTARNVALNFLSRREHGVEELRSKLLNKNFLPTEIDNAIDKLIQENLLSEERFVESFIRAKIAKGFGPVAIKNELGVRKIHGELIDQILDGMGVPWLEIARKVFEKKFSTVDLNGPKEKARCWRFLLQRGFTHEQINQLTRTLFE